MGKKRIHDFTIIAPIGDEIIVVDKPNGTGGYEVKGVLLSAISSLGANSSDDITNLSLVSGVSVTDALNNLFADIGFDWIDLVSSFKTPPTINGAIGSGTVWNYVYDDGAGGNVNRYRLVPSPYDPSLDAFYSGFDGTNLTGLIVTRAIEVDI